MVPELGAGLASYDLVDAGGRTPLFRPCRELSDAHPFELANNLLLPWSNRISGGGFHFAGKFHPLAPNLPGEPYPIHGNGFSSAWTVEAAGPAGVELSLASDGPGPFRYAARPSYQLDAGALAIGLSIVNRAAEARGLHGPRSSLSGEEGALEDVVEKTIEFELGHLEEGLRREDAGIVEQHIEAAEAVERRLHESFAGKLRTGETTWTLSRHGMH